MNLHLQVYIFFNASTISSTSWSLPTPVSKGTPLNAGTPTSSWILEVVRSRSMPSRFSAMLPTLHCLVITSMPRSASSSFNRVATIVDEAAPVPHETKIVYFLILSISALLSIYLILLTTFLLFGACIDLTERDQPPPLYPT
jgi:hypothetical protein